LKSASALHAALAEPQREAIVRLLAEGESAVGEIAQRLPISRPAVSKHLRLLQDAGLVQFRSEGTRNLYRLRAEALQALRDEIDAMWRQALARYALVANNVPAMAPAAKAASHPKPPPAGRPQRVANPKKQRPR
jgi:DNA-binding transcriptional ArsR family regulator